MSTAEADRPRVALTMGDVAGIGPEVIVRACLDQRVHRQCRPVVVGHPDVLQRAADLVHAEVPITCLEHPGQCPANSPSLPCWNPAGQEAAQVMPGRVDARAGRAAYEYLVAAARAALQGHFDALTTAPLNKAVLHRAGLDYPGHTEMLADVCGAGKVAMMLYLPAGPRVRAPHGLGVSHVTLHTALSRVPQLLSAEAIHHAIALMSEFLRDLGCSWPRVAVCAFNPHAGEEGLFGEEEQRIIRPAVDQAAEAGLHAVGPLPADTLFPRAVNGEFDGVVAMYHDQGHIALKLLGFEQAVNVTLGLPIVRTSPSHGTAFDIAWRGEARAAGMIEATCVASRLVAHRLSRRAPSEIR